MNLYQISAEYSQILDELYDEEGNVNEQALMKLEQNELAMEKKAIAIASFIKNMDAEREAIDTAKKAMAEREKRFKKRIDELEGYLLSNMEKRGVNKISCAYFDIKLKKCPPSVDIIDEASLPDEYKRTKTEILPDKIKMKDEMLAGVLIPGAQLKVNMRLEIR
jgi:hypothetical protein